MSDISDTISAIRMPSDKTKRLYVPPLWESVMKVQVVLEPSDEGGYTVVVPALPGCISEGETKEEALQNIREAVALYLESVEDDQTFAPNAESLELTV